MCVCVCVRACVRVYNMFNLAVHSDFFTDYYKILLLHFYPYPLFFLCFQFLESPDKLMSVAVPLHSLRMDFICRMLNKEGRRLEAGWRSLAKAWDIPATTLETFEPERQSPTSALFEFLSATRPDMTVEHLCDVLKAIGRNDVVSLFRNPHRQESAYLINF